MTANYDNKTFTVGPALSPAQGYDTELVTIEKSRHNALPRGGVVGIAIGTVAATVALAFTILALWFCWRHRRHTKGQRSKSAADAEAVHAKAELDGVVKPRVLPGELGPEGDVMEMGAFSKAAEADCRHAVVELPGGWVGNEVEGWTAR